MNNIPFNELKVSTITMMCYTNLIINLGVLYKSLDVYEIKNPPLMKKKKIPNIKQVEAPYGKIINVKMGNSFRGLETKNKKKKEGGRTYFLNQVTCILSLGNKKNINIFLFDDALKISGCKSHEHAEEIIMVLCQVLVYLHPFYNIRSILLLLSFIILRV